ncbi:MAG TPA: WxcM-like domain-containing protein [Galbitalea sp.]|nr:WxcM-like domain-containing protein [Galbitalea sp.]
MSNDEVTITPSHTDHRGTLIAAEFSDVPFVVARVFVVRGPEGGAVRGNHTVAGTQLLILLSGTSTIEFGTDADHLDHVVTLTETGSRILLADGTYIRYALPDEHSSILVLCEQPFTARS